MSRGIGIGAVLALLLTGFAAADSLRTEAGHRRPRPGEAEGRASQDSPARQAQGGRR